MAWSVHPEAASLCEDGVGQAMLDLPSRSVSRLSDWARPSFSVCCFCVKGQPQRHGGQRGQKLARSGRKALGQGRQGHAASGGVATQLDTGSRTHPFPRMGCRRSRAQGDCVGDSPVTEVLHTGELAVGELCGEAETAHPGVGSRVRVTAGGEGGGASGGLLHPSPRALLLSVLAPLRATWHVCLGLGPRGPLCMAVGP